MDMAHNQNRQIMFFMAPDIEVANTLEGDFISEEVTTIYTNKSNNDKKEVDEREKNLDTKEKIHKIMNKATKLL